MESVEIEKFYLGCLAHASYLIGSDGVAAVIDPQRDVEMYIDTARKNAWNIQYVIETHVHADFVSGHRELAERTGAAIYLGEGSGAQFLHVAVKDGDEIHFGRCSMQFLHTPGHTIESICVLMKDIGQPQRPAVVFTGDTLFVGDVGRPDLSPTHSPQQLAAILYQSLHQKLLTLPDDTEIYPAHGAGSLCGRQLSSESSSTIGRQRQTNYALRARSMEEFVSLLTDNLGSAPEYFATEVDLNRRGASPLSELRSISSLDARQVTSLVSQGAVVLDTRPSAQFAAAHVPGSLHMALAGQYASWAARIIGLNTPIIIVAEDREQVSESQLRLARVGIETVAGYLDDGISGWIKDGGELQSMSQITVTDLADLLQHEPDQVRVLDVREPAEAEGGAIENSLLIPLGNLKSRIAELDGSSLLAVHCKGGYRSAIAVSLLRRAGLRNVANIIGGFDAWRASGF